MKSFVSSNRLPRLIAFFQVHSNFKKKIKDEAKDILEPRRQGNRQTNRIPVRPATEREIIDSRRRLPCCHLRGRTPKRLCEASQWLREVLELLKTDHGP